MNLWVSRDDRPRNEPHHSAAPSARRILLASLVGTAVEFYDFYIYATAASLVFGPLFFPAVVAVGAAARGLCELRRRVLRAAARRQRVRPLRRPHRPQVDARGLAAVDGRLDHGDRVPAHLRHRGLAGADAAVPAALRPGLRPGRRVGRRGAAGGGERAAGLSRALRHVPAARRAGGLHRGQRRVPAARPRADARAVSSLGLAPAVSRQRAAGRRGAVGAASLDRDAGLRSGRR